MLHPACGILPCPAFSWRGDLLHTLGSSGVMVTTQGTPWGKSPPRAKGDPLGIGTASSWWAGGGLGCAKTLAESWQRWLDVSGRGLQLKRGHKRLNSGSAGTGRTPCVSWAAAQGYVAPGVQRPGSGVAALGQGERHTPAWASHPTVGITPWRGHRIPLQVSHPTVGILSWHGHRIPLHPDMGITAHHGHRHPP